MPFGYSSGLEIRSKEGQQSPVCQRQLDHSRHSFEVFYFDSSGRYQSPSTRPLRDCMNCTPDKNRNRECKGFIPVNGVTQTTVPLTIDSAYYLG